MNRILKPLAAAAALTLGAGAAHAQGGMSPGAGAPPGPGYTAENNSVRVPGDTSERDALAARDAELAKARAKRGDDSKRSARSVPAKPEDVIVGAEVRDAKGTRVGVIESVSMGAAVLKADGGAVEVPLEAFGKNSSGLLIGMTKADFDKLVADASKPAG